AQKVIGVDLDPRAVSVAKENVKNSNIKDKVIIVRGDLLDTIEEKADIIVANILAEAVAHMTKDVKKYLNKEGTFISSGIILNKIDLVRDSLLDNGFKIKEIKTMNEWACIIASLK